MKGIRKCSRSGARSDHVDAGLPQDVADEHPDGPRIVDDKRKHGRLSARDPGANT
jgi:hypothetical protein